MNNIFQNIYSILFYTLLLLERHYSKCQIYLAFDTSHEGDFFYLFDVLNAKNNTLNASTLSNKQNDTPPLICINVMLSLTTT